MDSTAPRRTPLPSIPITVFGYAQTWQLSVQRDLPAAHADGGNLFRREGHAWRAADSSQHAIPSAQPNPCAGLSLRDLCIAPRAAIPYARPDKFSCAAGCTMDFTASLEYTYSKSIDDDAVNWAARVTLLRASQSQSAASGSSSSLLRGRCAELARSHAASARSPTFDQRQLVKVSLRNTPAARGSHGGTLMSGWRGRLLKEWTLLGTLVSRTPDCRRRRSIQTSMFRARDFQR
jgi:hypothetical protein